ncbi:MAG: 16S rRNA (guanine(527)-N(7))-methyltransferase RsmG [Coriobacteriales bacterium]|nr:16S rRNA (guanine(527)-N(7))-methyltransferase RsmG [Coriobacteriales bacterium]
MQSNSVMSGKQDSFGPRLKKLGREQQDLLVKHLNLVIETNKTINVTRISDYHDGLIHHIEDSLAGLDALRKAPEGKLADIGSGAGYPGIPLAVVSGRATTLIESIQKKAAALNSYLEAMKTGETIRVEARRAEELAQQYREHYAVVCARAVSELPVLVELAAPLLCRSGLLLCYKGRPSEEELRRGDCAAELCGMKAIEPEIYSLNETITERMIVLYQKQSKPSIHLPRRVGLAKKHPLA